LTTQPTLETQRLVLRPWTLGDAAALQELAGQREIADTTISIPHPCTEENAREWIAEKAQAFAERKGAGFGLELKETKQLIGAVGLREMRLEHGEAELGFWLGVLWWGKGYGTEAARAALRYGFAAIGLNRICAHHMVRNPASGRVLEKIGMKREGLLRQHVRKWGVFEDVVLLAILREEWVRQTSIGSPGCDEPVQVEAYSRLWRS